MIKSLRAYKMKRNSLIIAKLVKKYFNKPYRDEPCSVVISGITIERPNHGLAHGMRQGFLAVDIVEGMTKFSIESDEVSPYFRAFCVWVRQTIRKDVYFLNKIQLVASFLRSGRESEVSSSHNGLLYRSYERNDMRNFIQECSPFIGKLFHDKHELFTYAESLQWDGGGEATNLCRILRAVHLLDLRRINSFDATRIMGNLKDALCLGNSYLERDFIMHLWDKSGKYLKVTGDRDMVYQRCYQSIFARVSSDSDKLVDILYAAR